MVGHIFSFFTKMIPSTYLILFHLFDEIVSDTNMVNVVSYLMFDGVRVQEGGEVAFGYTRKVEFLKIVGEDLSYFLSAISLKIVSAVVKVSHYP